MPVSAFPRENKEFHRQYFRMCPELICINYSLDSPNYTFSLHKNQVCSKHSKHLLLSFAHKSKGDSTAKQEHCNGMILVITFNGIKKAE